MKRVLTALLIGLAFASLGYAQSATRAGAKTLPGSEPRAAVTVSDSEALVLSRLHAANQAEISAGALAVERAQSAEVRSYGRHLVADHTAADRKLTGLAKRKNVTLTDSQSDRVNTLKASKDTEFDGLFISAMVKDHDEAITMVSEAQASAKDPDVLAFLKKTLPTLEKHKAMAQKISDKLSS